MSTFWSLWVMALVTLTAVGSWWLLQSNRKVPPGEGATTGHEWDGIEELNNPLPYWWYIMFILSLLFLVAYLVLYPGFGTFPGVLNWSSTGAWQKEVQEAEKEFGPLFARYGAMSVEQLQQEPQALKMGQRIFATNCSVCHGSSATGSFGFPNLTDSEWLYGGTAEAIETTILSGRRGQMPPWGSILGDEKVKQVTAHVVSLSGGTADPKLAEAGKAVFASTCTACHGMDGKGNQLIGAPDLTNAIWLYGGAPGQIEHSIAAGRAGQMPTFEQTLGAQKVRIVAAYVYSLSQPKK